MSWPISKLQLGNFHATTKNGINILASLFPRYLKCLSGLSQARWRNKMLSKQLCLTVDDDHVPNVATPRNSCWTTFSPRLRDWLKYPSNRSAINQICWDKNATWPKLMFTVLLSRHQTKTRINTIDKLIAINYSLFILIIAINYFCIN